MNTSTRNWVVSADQNSPELLLRDWEELPDSDETDFKWDILIHSLLNPYSCFFRPAPGRGLLSSEALVFVKEKGFVKLSEVRIGDFVKDKDSFTEVLGIYCDISGSSDSIWIWNSEEMLWVHPNEKDTYRKIRQSEKNGCQLVTSSGSFLADLVLVRDFTEVGWDRIHETYSFTLDKLNSI